jgi:hypothetical protein
MPLEVEAGPEHHRHAQRAGLGAECSTHLLEQVDVPGGPEVPRRWGSRSTGRRGETQVVGVAALTTQPVRTVGDEDAVESF